MESLFYKLPDKIVNVLVFTHVEVVDQWLWSLNEIGKKRIANLNAARDGEVLKSLGRN